MDPSCLLSAVQTSGGVIVWGIFSWYTLDPLVPTEHHLNTTYLINVADHVHPFMTTFLIATSSRITHYVTKIISSRSSFINITAVLKWPQPSPDLEQSTCGIWSEGRFTSWMCSQQICSNRVML